MNKLKQIFKILFIFLIFFSLSSCVEEEEKHYTNLPPDEMPPIDWTTAINTDNPYDNIGHEHNVCLDSLNRHIDVSDVETPQGLETMLHACISYVKTQLESDTTSFYSQTKMFVDDMDSCFFNFIDRFYYLGDTVAPGENQAIKQVVLDVIDMTMNRDSLDYDELKNYIEQKESYLIDNMLASRWFNFLSFTATLRYSLSYWDKYSSQKNEMKAISSIADALATSVFGAKLGAIVSKYVQEKNKTRNNISISIENDTPLVNF